MYKNKQGNTSKSLNHSHQNSEDWDKQNQINFIPDEKVKYFTNWHLRNFTHKNCNLINMRTLFDNKQCQALNRTNNDQLVSIPIWFLLNNINEATRNSKVDPEEVEDIPTQN